MKIDSNTALVLEGGGLRGVFTCGVLDFFMDLIERLKIGFPIPGRIQGSRKNLGR